MSATVRDVVINLALNGVSGVTSAINQVQNQLDKLRATPGPSLLPAQSSNAGVSSLASASLLNGFLTNMTSTGQKANPVSNASPTPTSSHPGITEMRGDMAAMLQAIRELKVAQSNPAAPLPAVPSISSFQKPVAASPDQLLATQSANSVASSAQSAILSGIRTTFSTVGVLFKQIANIVSGSSTAATIAATSASQAANIATQAGTSVVNSSSVLAKLLPALNVLGTGAGNVVHQIATAHGGGPSETSIPHFNPSVLLNPWTAVAAAAVATAVALRNLNISTQKLEEEQRADQTKYRTIEETAANAAVGRHVDQSMQLMHAKPNFGEIRQVSLNEHRRSATEAEIRQEQANSPNDFSRHQEVRSRAERHQDLLERADSAKNVMEHVNQKPKELAAAQAKLDSDRKTSEEAYQRKIAAKKKELLPPPAPPAVPAGPTISGWLYRNAKQTLGRTSYGKSLVDTTSDLAGDFHRTRKAIGQSILGNKTESQRDQKHQSVQNDLKEMEVGRAGEVARQLQEQVKINKENVAVGQQQAQAAAERLNSLRAITAETRRNAEADKEQIKGIKRSVGFATPGERTRIRALTAKVQAVKAGKLPRSAITQFDMEGLANAPQGTEEHDFGKAEAERRGDGPGLWTIKPELKKSQEKADEAQKNQDKEEPELLRRVKDFGQKNEEAVKKLVEAMEKAFAADEFFAQLETTLKSQQEAFAKNIKSMSFWFK